MSNVIVLNSMGHLEESALSAGGATLGASVSGGYVTRSGTDLLFSPDNSNIVFAYESSVWTGHTIPDAGVTVGCTGLTASTDYYLYVYDNSGTLTLDISTTAPTTQNGISVKTGATDRLMIARCYTDGSGDVLDTDNQRFIISVYNKRLRRLITENSINNWSYTVSAWRELNAGTGQTRAEFIGDGTSTFYMMGAGLTYLSTTGITQLSIGYDVTNAPIGASSFCAYNQYSNHAFSYTTTPTAGYHYATLLEKCGVNTTKQYGSPEYGTRGYGFIEG